MSKARMITLLRVAGLLALIPVTVITTQRFMQMTSQAKAQDTVSPNDDIVPECAAGGEAGAQVYYETNDIVLRAQARLRCDPLNNQNGKCCYHFAVSYQAAPDVSTYTTDVYKTLDRGQSDAVMTTYWSKTYPVINGRYSVTTTLYNAGCNKGELDDFIDIARDNLTLP